MIKQKSPVRASETWLSAITAVGALVAAHTNSIDGAGTWVAVAVCVALAGTFAFFKTPLAAKDGVSGVKTRTFWTSIAVILASIAAALAEADIAGLPPEVTQIAGTVTATLVAAGYNVWRYSKKTGMGRAHAK